jgi:ribonuclease HII
MLVLGIDDAGRGPIIGPMILAGVLLEEKDEQKLRNLGVKDSKQVIQSKRIILAEEIKRTAVSYYTVAIHANEIDGRESAGLNLNKLEAVKMAAIVNQLNKTKEKIKVFIDCPSTNIKKWQEYLEGYVENTENLEFFVEHKADVHHVSCSAASILAKVTREEEVEKIKQRIGKDFGSGYPSDPVTKKFIEEHGKEYKKEGIIRETWATWQNQKTKKSQASLNDFEKK